MQPGIVICGGEAPSLDSLKNSGIPTGEALSIAADSGYLTAVRLGLHVDKIVGDFDSSVPPPSHVFPARNILRAPVDKDETDTEMALRLLREAGCSPVYLVGGGGGRLDHLAALWSMLSRDAGPDYWLANGSFVEVLRKNAVILRKCKPGQTVSVFPAGTEALSAQSEGLFWPIDDILFGCGMFSISNRTTGSSFSLKVNQGIALLVRPCEDLELE